MVWEMVTGELPWDGSNFQVTCTPVFVSQCTRPFQLYCTPRRSAHRCSPAHAPRSPLCAHACVSS
eukprot:2610439-Rhodomonas_salina.1